MTTGKRKFFLILSFICILLQGGLKNHLAGEAKISAQKKTMGIVLIRNSSVRIDPFFFSARITLLKKGETVEIIDRSAEKSWIGKSRDYWYKIKIKNGITGWIFGTNIKILTTDNSVKIKKFVTDFFKGETENMMKELSGKWWSINRFGDFTRHGIEFNSKGLYKSYIKSQNPKIYEGHYRIDFHNNMLLFEDGTTFGEKLKFIKRGSSYVLKKELKAGELVFKKISIQNTIDKNKK